MGDKLTKCVKCGAELIVTSTCEFEPSISHAQCCGLSYTIGEPSTDTAAADQECACDNCNICVEQLREEVRRLREENERLTEELSALKDPSDARCMEIGMLREQREKLQAQVERLKDALEDRDRRECAKGV